MLSQRLSALARNPRLLLSLITFGIYGGYAVTRYSQFLTAGYDLGIFDQVVRRYSHFQAPIIALKGPGYNIFGDHFHPIIASAAPFYWIWDDPRMLLLVQALLVAISVAIVHRFCSRHLSESNALMLSMAYALGWPLQALIHFDFHEIAFGVPLIAWTIDALDRRALKEVVASCLLLLLVREDMGLIVLVLAGITFFRLSKRAGAALAVIGIATYVVVTSIVLPHFNPAGSFAYWQYDALGPDAPSAIKSLILHPIHGLNLFFTPAMKSITILWLLLPVLFLALRSPYTLCILPILAERFFASRENLWGTRFHYSAILWPVILLAAVDAARRMRKLENKRLVSWVVVLALLLPVVGTAVYRPLWPLNRAVAGKAFTLKAKMRYQERIIKLIPHNTCVEADDHLASHLTRHNLVIHPTDKPVNEDFILVDLSNDHIGYLMPTSYDIMQNAIDAGYIPSASVGTIVVLQSPTYDGPSKECSPTG